MNRTTEAFDESGTLALEFHIRVFNDEKLVSSLVRLWIEFGQDIDTVLGSDEYFGQWMGGIAKMLARVYEEQALDETPF